LCHFKIFSFLLATPFTNTAWFAPGFVNYKKSALDSQPQVIKFTSCLPVVGGSLRHPALFEREVAKLEKVQLESARIVTGLTKFAK
jgi:hypothetical protein